VKIVKERAGLPDRLPALLSQIKTVGDENSLKDGQKNGDFC